LKDGTYTIVDQLDKTKTFALKISEGQGVISLEILSLGSYILKIVD
jgi:hypothetical protein